jgi:hypothetical protein
MHLTYLKSIMKISTKKDIRTIKCKESVEIIDIEGVTRYGVSLNDCEVFVRNKKAQGSA